MALYKHQIIAYNYLLSEESFALFAEQGTGKTLSMLKRIVDGLRDGEFRNALVVAPKAVMGAWVRDQQFFTPDERKLLAEKLIIINYDMVWRDARFRQQFDCIVLDESHFIKNPTRNRSKFLLNLSLRAKYRYILTGTPINNGKLHEYWAQMAFLKPIPGYKKGFVNSEWFGSYGKFKDKYCILDQYFQPKAYTHISEIQQIVSDHSYRILKKDCLDLPEKLPDEIYDIELKIKPIYKELRDKSAIKSLGLVAENPLTKMLRMRQLASGYVVDDFGETHRFPCEKETVLEEFLEGFDKKLVIFAEFRESIDNITKVVKKAGLSYVIQDGRQKDKNIWQKFQADDSIRVIICQYQSASMGIDLFASDTILYYEPTVSTNLLEQSRDRIHRIGQSEKCSYIHFLTTGSIEPEIYKRLAAFSDFHEKQFEEYMENYVRRREKGGKTR